MSLALISNPPSIPLNGMSNCYGVHNAQYNYGAPRITFSHISNVSSQSRTNSGLKGSLYCTLEHSDVIFPFVIQRTSIPTSSCRLREFRNLRRNF